MTPVHPVSLAWLRACVRRLTRREDVIVPEGVVRPPQLLRPRETRVLFGHIEEFRV
jgi:hypothetical protein